MDHACLSKDLACFLAEGIKPGVPYWLNPEESHHLKNVLRLKAGEKLALLDLEGREYLGKVLKIDKAGVLVKAESLLRYEEPLKPKLIFLLPLLKKDWLSFLVEKAVELGVYEVIPVLTERTVVKPGPNLTAKLEKRARQSLKQCRRLWPLHIKEPLPLSKAAKITADLKVFAYERESQKTLAETLKTSLKVKSACFITGPEGGFSRQEAALLLKHQFKPAGLGHLILRAETAALYLMCVAHFNLFLQKS
ncbi:RsmE family RNA methyltransferase [Thermodesulfatator autotrophicus]|uniref:Ribosomal RNA small subunit methyltransferase E n=1 Tax=Thermodesulfatator autotrophicus TaxID=1795632 RepID=A0A177E9D0_9BACT|nr:16S rRNA (uracil(1498)-N(3))-methyltransferase [Thermodesulfatator autotrophicus]OAG28020.1 hypothetical protein TH606_04070 [Thermodesulfatator autotrophicus]